MTPYIFQRGETISLALDAVTGDPLSVTAISAAMKAVAPGRTSVNAGDAGCRRLRYQPESRAGRHSAGMELDS